MKNPFVAAAAMMAVISAAMRENAMRNFYGKAFEGHSGSATPKRPKHNPAGSKLACKAAMHQFGTMRGQIVTLKGRSA